MPKTRLWLWSSHAGSALSAASISLSPNSTPRLAENMGRRRNARHAITRTELPNAQRSRVSVNRWGQYPLIAIRQSGAPDVVSKNLTPNLESPGRLRVILSQFIGVGVRNANLHSPSSGTGETSTARHPTDAASSSLSTASRLKVMTRSWPHRVASARSAERMNRISTVGLAENSFLRLTIAMTLGAFAAFSARDVTALSVC